MKLFEDEKDCCGCGACMNACPKQAITLQEDRFGFLFPAVDAKQCVACGKCIAVCPWNKDISVSDYKNNYFFAARKDEKKRNCSASGGIAAALTEDALTRGAHVFGCVMQRVDTQFQVFHMEAENIEQAQGFRGSKYVQSNMGWTHRQVRERLEEGKSVLFIGTPCQVAGLKSYLGTEYDALYTIDLVCHGVSNQKFFHDYILFLERKKKWNIRNVRFRAKYKNIDASKHYYMEVQLKNSRKKLFSKLQSYYGYFLNGDSYRTSCYNCKYACSNRVGDITLGDGWGIEHMEPKALKENGGNLVNAQGVSCVLVNSPKGMELFQRISNEIDYYETSFDKISKQNHQLMFPTPYRTFRETLFDLYVRGGYSDVDKLYYTRLDKKMLFNWKYYLPISNMISDKQKRALKRMLHK